MIQYVNFLDMKFLYIYDIPLLFLYPFPAAARAGNELETGNRNNK